MSSRLYESIQNQYNNYTAPFLWLHNEDDEAIIDELKRIRGCGIRAVCLESRTHEEFCREDWWSDVAMILKTCRELEMKVWILDDKHFPSGYANGAFEERYRHLQMWNITEFHVDVAGPVREGCVMTDIWKIEEDDEIVGAVALKRIPNSDSYTGEAYDLSGGIANGMVYFDLPDGVYSIVILVKSRFGTGEYHRAFCDKLNPEATDVFIREVYEPHYTHFKEEFGKTLLGFFSDEPAFWNNMRNRCFTPMGEKFQYYPWHESVLQALREQFGDDALVMLCGIWFPFADGKSSIARNAYMDIITKMYQENFCEKIGKWCEQRGVRYIGHVIEDNNAHAMTGNGAGHYFRALSGQHMSGIDVVLHQIIPGLTEYSNTGEVEYKQMSNDFFHYVLAKLAVSAAQLEEKKQGMAMCEIFGAYGWAEGTKIMKYLTDHMLVRGINYFVPHAFSPKKDDEDCPPNFYGSGKNPQFKYFHMMMEYQNRMCHMLSGGKHIVACALIYDAESRWSADEFYPLEKAAKVLYDAQLDYDIIPFDLLDGELPYSVVIVPYTCYINPEHYKKLQNIRAHVICTGDKAIDGLDFVAVEKLATFMEPYRDVWVENPKGFIRYYHYRQPDMDLYVFSNEDITQTVETKIRLRDFVGSDYVVYDAFENTAVKIHSSANQIALTLAPYNALVVATGNLSELRIPEFAEKEILAEQELDVRYDVKICAEECMPDFEDYKEIEELENITGRYGLPHFSGNIKYTCVFEAKDEAYTILDLGTVGETASVTINGMEVGTRLFPPYEFDISNAVKPGENKLEVLISNTCGYRLRDGFSKWLLFEPSGLLGPVKLKKVKTIK